MPYESPGFAVANTLQAILARRKAEQRQTMLDEIAAKNQASLEQDRVMNRRIQLLTAQSMADERDAHEKQRLQDAFVAPPTNTLTDPGSAFMKEAEAAGYGGRFDKQGGATLPTTSISGGVDLPTAPQQLNTIKPEKVASQADASVPTHMQWKGTPEQSWSEDENVQKAIDDGDINEARRLMAVHGVPAKDIPKLLASVAGGAITTMWGADGKPHSFHMVNGNPVELTGLAGMRKTNPITTAIQTRMVWAQNGVAKTPSIVQEIDAIDKMGWTGPLAGRWADLLVGKVGSTGDPNKDAMIARMRDDLSFLKSAFAVVHGGARGGSSIEMAKRFDNLINAQNMSAAELKSGVAAIHDWLEGYAKSPLEIEKDMNRAEDEWQRLIDSGIISQNSLSPGSPHAESKEGDAPPAADGSPAEPGAPAAAATPEFHFDLNTGRMVPSEGGQKAPAAPPQVAPGAAPVNAATSPVAKPPQQGLAVAPVPQDKWADLKQFEGFRDTAYDDHGTGQAIGYGMHTWMGEPVKPGMKVTKQQADTEMLRQLDSYYIPAVRNALEIRNVHLTPDQFKMLVSIAYNAGPNSNAVHSIITKLSKGIKVNLQDFLKSATSNHQPNAGLAVRRAAEFKPFE